MSGDPFPYGPFQYPVTMGLAPLQPFVAPVTVQVQGGLRLSDEDVERIARRVIEMMKETAK